MRSKPGRPRYRTAFRLASSVSQMWLVPNLDFSSGDYATSFARKRKACAARLRFCVRRRRRHAGGRVFRVHRSIWKKTMRCETNWPEGMADDINGWFAIAFAKAALRLLADRPGGRRWVLEFIADELAE